MCTDDNISTVKIKINKSNSCLDNNLGIACTAYFCLSFPRIRIDLISPSNCIFKSLNGFSILFSVAQRPPRVFTCRKTEKFLVRIWLTRSVSKTCKTKTKFIKSHTCSTVLMLHFYTAYREVRNVCRWLVSVVRSILEVFERAVFWKGASQLTCSGLYCKVVWVRK